MEEQALEAWFAANKTLLETAYLRGVHPWQQSGFGLNSPRTYARWQAQRGPIAECLDRSGSFLDIGCANGFLLECVLSWATERGVQIEPFGLDFSEALIALAKARLPAHAHHLYVDNAWTWEPPFPFDFVRTELEYVPPEIRQAFVARLLTRCVRRGGALLVADYRGRDDAREHLGIDRELTNMGFAVEITRSGFWEGVEMTRVAVVRATG